MPVDPAAAAGLGISAAEAETLLTAAGIDPAARAETLDIQRFLELGAVLRARP